MKKILLLILSILMIASTSLFATLEHDMKPYTGSAEFERLKALSGTWKGTSEMEGVKHDAAVQYYVTSNGSAVVEKLFPGTPHEMISVYYDKNGKPSMTHYCGLGNQPQMDLVSSNAQEMKFDFSPSSSVDATKEAHMHSLTLKFDGNDKLIHDWKFFKDGSGSGDTIITLTREH